MMGCTNPSRVASLNPANSSVFDDSQMSYVFGYKILVTTVNFPEVMDSADIDISVLVVFQNS